MRVGARLVSLPSEVVWLWLSRGSLALQVSWLIQAHLGPEVFWRLTLLKSPGRSLVLEVKPAVALPIRGLLPQRAALEAI